MNIFLLSGLLVNVLLVFNAFCVLVNGHELTSLIKPADEVLVFKPDHGNVGVRLTYNTIELGSIELTNSQDYNTPSTKLHKQAKECTQYISPDITIKSEELSLRKNYFSAQRVWLDTSKDLVIYDTIIEAEKTFFGGAKMKFVGCSLVGDSLQLESCDPHSLIQVMIFKFNKKGDVKTGIQGTINFVDNSSAEDLIVTGVDTIEIAFNSAMVGK